MNLIIIQARLGSTRLPGKVLKPLFDNKTILELLIERLTPSKLADKIIIATTDKTSDDAIASFCHTNNIECYRGSENDVLDRFYQAAKQYDNVSAVVRLTADCPLNNYQTVDFAIGKFKENNADYFSNSNNQPDFLEDGFDVEVFSFEALEQAWKNATLKSDREHVSPFIKKQKSNKCFWEKTNENYNFKLSVDTADDFKIVKEIYSGLKEKPFFTIEDVVNYLSKNKHLLELNKNSVINAGYKKSLLEDKTMNLITNFKKSDEYRRVIHNLIPGGAHTYSKGDDQFPINSPAAITHGKGPYVWDLDGNKFFDTLMGLTSVSLGHAYEPVIERIIEELKRGSNFSRPSTIERQMAERFIDLIPGHDMIKFAKNGSVATTAAVKLSRAYTGRSLVARPFDHPFYSYDDWFIGSTACDFGVPQGIKDMTVMYKADDLDSLKELFDKYPDQIACVISEPEKFNKIEPDYYKNAIDFVHEKGALWIMDEMITGFKTDYPGSIKKFGAEPDLATWGKGIANGFSFCALTGKKEVMSLGGIKNEGSKKVFLVSTTHGGETSAIAAALATMDVFENNDVIGHNQMIGDYYIKGVNEILSQKNLHDYIKLTGFNWSPGMLINGPDKQPSMHYRTLIMQEMIKRGILFQGILSPAFTMTSSDIDTMLEAFNESTDVFLKALEGNIADFLIGPEIKPVFRKYN